MVGAGGPDQVWVLASATWVPGPEDGLAQAVAPWEWVEIVLVGVNGAIEVIVVTRTIRILNGRLDLGAGQVLLGKFQAGGQTLLWRVLVGGSKC